jgi:hypothetical protein
MASVSGSIPNLIGGISQQPPEIRALNTASSLRNTVSSVSTGLSTRPAARFIGVLPQTPGPSYSVAKHVIQKPSGNYQITVVNGALSVIDLDNGAISTLITVGDAADYIAGSDPAKDLGFVTIADTTFIFNRTVTTTATRYVESGVTCISHEGVNRKSPNRHGTLWLKQRAGYKANYAAYYNGVRRSLVTTDTLSPSEIATQFVTDLSGAGYTASKVSETVISVTLGAELDYVNISDDLAGQASLAINDNVAQFTDLPNFDTEGRLVLVKQDLAETRDDYWVWYANGEWKETFGWDSREIPDEATMPHVLIDNRDGSFTLTAHSWDGRIVGDIDSNPTPSFIGNPITHMWVYKGRMCILSDENFLASQVGKFENFYRSSCTILLDEDRIDIAAPNGSGATLRHARVFDNALLIFSALDQIRIEGDRNGLFGPNTVVISKVNEYNCSARVSPVQIGPNIMFVDDFQTKQFASVREYQIDRQYGRQVAPAITDAIPELIPSGVAEMASSSSDDIAVIRSVGSPNSLWLYNYYFNNEGKVQSSWQEWTFGYKTHTVAFMTDLLVVTLEVDGKLIVTTMSFDASSDGVFDDDSVLLDLRVSSWDITVAHAAGVTTVTLPYTIPTEDRDKFRLVLAASNEGTAPSGKIQKPTGGTGNTLQFTGDLTGEDFFVGRFFTMYWRLNPIYIRDQKQVVIQDGRLQLRGVSLLFSNSGPFTAVVTPAQRDSYTSVYSGYRIGSGFDPIGTMSLDTGSFRFAAYGEAQTVVIEVFAETPYRARFSSMEWDGTHRPKRKRMS